MMIMPRLNRIVRWSSAIVALASLGTAIAPATARTATFPELACQRDIVEQIEDTTSVNSFVRFDDDVTEVSLTRAQVRVQGRGEQVLTGFDGDLTLAEFGYTCVVNTRTGLVQANYRSTSPRRSDFAPTDTTSIERVWTGEIVIDNTTARSADGSELFEFRARENVAVDWDDTLEIDDGVSRSYVYARNQFGRRGYIRIDRLDNNDSRPLRLTDLLDLLQE